MTVTSTTSSAPTPRPGAHRARPARRDHARQHSGPAPLRLPQAQRWRVTQVPLSSVLKVTLVAALISAAAIILGTAGAWSIGNELGLREAIDRFGRAIGLSGLRVSDHALLTAVALVAAGWAVVMTTIAAVVTLSFNAAARLFHGIPIEVETPPADPLGREDQGRAVQLPLTASAPTTDAS